MTGGPGAQTYHPLPALPSTSEEPATPRLAKPGRALPLHAMPAVTDHAVRCGT